MRQLVGRVPAAREVALGGAALLAVACFLPWGKYSGFPGKMTLAGQPGGARVHVLLLALLALFLLRPRAGAWRAARRASAYGVAAVVFTLVFIAYGGGGLVNVAYGGWLALVGALVFAVAAQSVEDTGPAAPRRLPAVPARGVLERLVVVGVAVTALILFVVGLGIPSATVADGEDFRLLGAISMNDLTNEGEFLSFLILVAGGGLALSSAGVLAGVSEITRKHQKLLIGAAVAAAMVFPFTQDGDGYSLRIAASIGVFAAAAVGLNIVVGLAGLLDLGYIAFFGVGAYFAALVSGSASSVFSLHLPFIVVVVLGAFVSGGFGVALGAPTLRLRGDYLAIVTLGFGEIFRIAANNLDGEAGPDLTNGPNGISDIPDLELGGFNWGDNHELFDIVLPFQANYFWLEILLICGVLLAFMRLSDSRIGRAWVAIREDELAAAATGINTTRMKLLAFALGAMLAGAAGTVYAHVLKVTEPNSFTFIESATLLAAVILGGMGTVPGALLGATVLYLLPEKLRFLQDLRLLVFGMALVLIMRFRPEGIIASRRRAREFHDDAGGGDALSAPPGHAEVSP